MLNNVLCHQSLPGENKLEKNLQRKLLMSNSKYQGKPIWVVSIITLTQRMSKPT